MRAIRLSGWARLWIVLIAPLWAGGVWSGLNNATVSWQGNCDSHICMAYGPFPASRSNFGQPHECRYVYSCHVLGYDRTELRPWERDRPVDLATGQPQPKYARSKYQRLEETRDQNDLSAYALLERYRSQLWEGVWVPTVIALLTFFLAMLAKSAALWVWRGFRPVKAPIRDGDA